MTTFRLEMKHGQPMREVDANDFTVDSTGGWIIFHRRPPQGGIVEYWRARLDCVVSMETVT